MKEASQILKPKFVSLFTVMKEALRSVTWVKVAIRRTIKKKSKYPVLKVVKCKNVLKNNLFYRKTAPCPDLF